MEMNISKDIRYVGVNDSTTDLFESQYIIPEGISYNSFVILDERVALMDTVDARFADEWLENVKRELAGRTPEYLVVSHVEPDHAGSIAVALKAFPTIKLVGNVKTFQFIEQFFALNLPESQRIIKTEGDKLELGAHTLSFILAPMVHWPEVMVSYELSEKVLFSADGFGKFGVPDDGEWDCEARRYYFNICGKYGVQVQSLLKKALALDIAKIAPLHGPVLTGDLSHYIKQYDTWSSYRPETEGVFIAYASIHGNTAVAANDLAEKLKVSGVKVAISDLSRDDIAECVEDAFRYDRIVLASPTYDAGIFSPMDDFLSHLKAKGYQNRKVAIIENGSWAPAAAKLMRSFMETLKNISFVEPVVSIKSALTAQSRAQLDELAKNLLK